MSPLRASAPPHSFTPYPAPTWQPYHYYHEFSQGTSNLHGQAVNSFFCLAY